MTQEQHTGGGIDFGPQRCALCHTSAIEAFAKTCNRPECPHRQGEGKEAMAVGAGRVNDRDVALALQMLTPTMPKALAALPREPGVWATVSEMRGRGANGACMDLLRCMGGGAGRHLCERRWATWGGEPGQKRGEGYEYTITPLGVAVRNALFAQPPTTPQGEDAQQALSAGGGE